MPEAFATHVQFAARTAERGPGYAAALAPAVTRRTDRGVYFDPDHPAVAAARQVRAAPAAHTMPTAATPPPAGQGPWDALHVGALTWPLDQAAARVLAYRDGLPNHPRAFRRNQFDRLRLAHPLPEPLTRPGLCRWTWTLHDASDRGRGLAGEPYGHAAARWGWPTALHVHQSANGIGDAIHGYYAACGLADATRESVVLHTKFGDWLARMSHPGVSVVERAEVGPDLNGAVPSDREGNYRRQVASAASRTAAYCANVAAGLGLPPFTARRPARVDRAMRRQDNPPGPFIVLVPYSHHKGREWPRPKWTELARRLVAMGLTPVAIDSDDALRRRQLADDFGGVAGALTITDRDASGVADLMLGSECVVALDSGGAHVAGMLSVPCVAVHAGSLPHGFLFGEAPSVSSVTAGQALPRADQNESALATVTVDAVLAEVVRRLGTWPRVARLAFMPFD